MYTVLWQEREDGRLIDRWDRFETEEDVKSLLESLETDPGVCETDAWIFTPEAENHAVDFEGFFGG